MAKTLEEHHSYLSDRVKLDRYQAAVERLVRPGHVVLDLGCGTGLLGLMALRAGAAKVIFVEEGAVIEVARRTMTEAGFADQSEFLQLNSFELALSEKVDVVICDHIGYFGFDYGVLALLADARQRFLKPDGVIVPAQIELLLAPIESESSRKLVGQWQDGSIPDEFSWVGTTAANTKHSAQLEESDLLADAITLATLDLGESAEPFLSWNAEFRCARDGMLDGVAGWFDCRLADDIHMTNSPAAAESLKRPQAFLPLESPVPVSAGEHIQATVMARHQDHVIGWIIELPESGQRFAHTTFNGLLLDKEALNRAQPDRVAELNDRGRARQIVLSYCDGQRTLAEVQAMVLKEHPDLFPSAQATNSFVEQVLAWDTGA
jgi:protein arginine N-methyltransferase 1